MPATPGRCCGAEEQPEPTTMEWPGRAAGSSYRASDLGPGHGGKRCQTRAASARSNSRAKRLKSTGPQSVLTESAPMTAAAALQSSASRPCRKPRVERAVAVASTDIAIVVGKMLARHKPRLMTGRTRHPSVRRRVGRAREQSLGNGEPGDEEDDVEVREPRENRRERREVNLGDVHLAASAAAIQANSSRRRIRRATSTARSVRDSALVIRGSPRAAVSGTLVQPRATPSRCKSMPRSAAI